MFWKKREPNKKHQHANEARKHMEELIRRQGVEAVVVDDNEVAAHLLEKELRERGINCVSVSDPQKIDTVIKLCSPRVIVLDFYGNEEVAQRIMLEYPTRAVVCSGTVHEALAKLADKVRRVFSKDNVDELATYIKTGA